MLSFKHPSHILLYRYGQCLQIDGEVFPAYIFRAIPLDIKWHTVSLFRWDIYPNVWGKCCEWWIRKCVGGHISICPPTLPSESLRTFAWKGRNCDITQLETRHRDLPSKKPVFYFKPLHCTFRHLAVQPVRILARLPVILMVSMIFRRRIPGIVFKFFMWPPTQLFQNHYYHSPMSFGAKSIADVAEKCVIKYTNKYIVFHTMCEYAAIFYNNLCRKLYARLTSSLKLFVTLCQKQS